MSSAARNLSGETGRHGYRPVEPALFGRIAWTSPHRSPLPVGVHMLPPGMGMIHYLGLACRELRKENGRLQSHIAAALDTSESRIKRFEKGERWPREPDLVIAAYAEECEVDPRELWRHALSLWAEDAIERAAKEIEQDAEGLPSARRRAGGSSGNGS